MVQLERYGEDKVALRVLKILDPVQDLAKDYDGFVYRPMEGELIQRHGKSESIVVTRNPSMMKDALTLPMHLEDLP